MRMTIQVTKFPNHGIDPLFGNFILLTMVSGRLMVSGQLMVSWFLDFRSHDLIQPFLHSSREVNQNIRLTGTDLLTFTVVIDPHGFVVIHTILG